MKIFLVTFFLALSWFIIAPAKVSADCAWFINAQCEDVGTNSQNRCGQQADNNCSEAKPNFDSAKCCCCLPTPLGCCLKTNNTTQEETAMTSTVAQCYANDTWATVKWYYGQVAKNNKCKKPCDYVVGSGGSTCRDADYPVSAALSVCRDAGLGDPKINEVCCCLETTTPDTEAATPVIPKAVKAVIPPFEYNSPTNPLQTVSVPIVAGRIIKALLAIIGSIFLLIIIYGGFLWMTAAGNDSKVLQGRNTLAWGVLGLVVISLAWVLTGFIFDIFSQI